MNKLDQLRKQLEIVKVEIERLSGFRDTSVTRKFRRQLEGEKSNILANIKKLTLTREEKQVAKLARQREANILRSVKNKRNWNFIDAIQKNYFPDKSKREIRSAYSRFRKGLETDISDVVWRNPSP